MVTWKVKCSQLSFHAIGPDPIQLLSNEIIQWWCSIEIHPVPTFSSHLVFSQFDYSSRNPPYSSCSVACLVITRPNSLHRFVILFQSILAVLNRCVWNDAASNHCNAFSHMTWMWRDYKPIIPMEKCVRRTYKPLSFLDVYGDKKLHFACVI